MILRMCPLLRAVACIRKNSQAATFAERDVYLHAFSRQQRVYLAARDGAPAARCVPVKPAVCTVAGSVTEKPSRFSLCLIFFPNFVPSCRAQCVVIIRAFCLTVGNAGTHREAVPLSMSTRRRGAFRLRYSFRRKV